jgi:cytochrome c oxidase cbb3-type subunit IV
MYKNVLQNINNIEIWPVISFVIFFVFFLCLLWHVFTTDKKLINEIEILPLEDATIVSINQNSTAV